MQNLLTKNSTFLVSKRRKYLDCVHTGRRTRCLEEEEEMSLAVSDLLVAVLVMPPAVAYEVMGRWSYGQHVCDMWTSLDVMLCTASILNLCAISVDRSVCISYTRWR